MKRFYKTSRVTLSILLGVVIYANAQLPFTLHSVPPGVVVNNARMNDLVIDASDNKWMAFGNYGLGIYDGANWTIYNMTNSAMPADSCTSIAFDISGNAWIGTKEGAVYKSGNNFTTYNTSNSGLPANIITTVYHESATTWFGTYNGLVEFDGSNWTAFNSVNSPLTNDSITVIRKDNSGNLFVGTRNGLFVKNGSNWNSYTPLNSSIKRFIIDLQTDNFGRTWISCGELTGVQNLIANEIFYIANGNLANFQSDFWPYDVTITIFRPTNFTRDSNGRLFFRATMSDTDGLVAIDGNDFDFYTMPPLNMGVGQFGNIFEFDNNNNIWTIPRFRFYFYELDLNNYQETLGNLTHLNFRFLNINDVEAGINVSGDMHWDFADPKYEVPKGSGKHSVFSSALWIGGYDQQGQLHVAGQTYRQTGNDFWPGPIDGVSAPFDSALSIQFDRIWKIDKWKIEQFKNEFLAGNVTNGTYSIPEEFATWPAKGNGIVTGNLAPFIDFNNDGFYNPMQGDYPSIKGDQMLFHVFNDSLAIHSATGGTKLGIEVRASSYAFNCSNIVDSNLVLNRTTLYHYQIINKSLHDYDSVYIGLWSDGDLGNYQDDYVGCDSSRAAGFTYNGDNNDEGISGYGLNPPMQNIKILRGALAPPNDGIDNNLNGIIDEPGERTTMNHFHTYNNVIGTPYGNPVTSFDFYNYMRSVWLDGTHVTYGGGGTNPSAVSSNFIYSGVPYGPGWTELSAGNPNGDRKFIMSSGPFSLASGDTATIDFAYIFTWDSLNPNGLNTSIARNHADLDRVQYWFDNNNFPSCEVYTTGIEQVKTNLYTLYPNPATTQLHIRKANIPANGINYTVFNLLGAMEMQGKVINGSLNIKHLRDQVYILKLETENGSEFFRFVKM